MSDSSTHEQPCEDVIKDTSKYGVRVCKGRAFSSFERWLLPPFYLFTCYVRLVKRAHFAQACRRARIKYQFGARAHLRATFRKGCIPHLGAHIQSDTIAEGYMGEICLARYIVCQCFEHCACLCQSSVWKVNVRDCCARPCLPRRPRLSALQAKPQFGLALSVQFKYK